MRASHVQTKVTEAERSYGQEMQETAIHARWPLIAQPPHTAMTTYRSLNGRLGRAWRPWMARIGKPFNRQHGGDVSAIEGHK